LLVDEDKPSGHDEAEALLQQGLIRFTDEASQCDMLFNLGLLLSFQPSRLAGAEVLWRRQLNIEECAGTLSNLADLVSKDPSRHREAKTLFWRALEFDPDLLVHGDLARLLNKDRRVALRCDGNVCLGTYCEVAYFLGELPGGCEKAESMCRQLQERHTEDAHVLHALGWVVAKDPGRSDEAEQLLRRALEIEPELQFATEELAVVLAARGNSSALTEAAGLCEHFMKEHQLGGSDPSDHAYSLAAAGIVLFHSGDEAAARHKLDEARKLDGQAKRSDSGNVTGTEFYMAKHLDRLLLGYPVE